jgi:hypothetical protein
MSTHGSDKKLGDRPRIATVVIAGVASAAGFFVITRSGLAGSLAGAAMASMIYTGAAHGLGAVIDRGASWWIRRRDTGGPSGECATPSTSHPTLAEAAPTGGSTGAPAEEGAPGGQTTPAGERHASRNGVRTATPDGRSGSWFLDVFPRRRLATWVPVALGVLALGVSAYALLAGEPLERVIVRERVVDRPVVEERIVVQHDVVTVTVPGSARPSSGGGGSSAAPTTSSTVVTGTTTPSQTATTTSLPTASGTGTDGATPSSTTLTTSPTAPTATEVAPAPQAP